MPLWVNGVGLADMRPRAETRDRSDRFYHLRDGDAPDRHAGNGEQP